MKDREAERDSELKNHLPPLSAPLWQRFVKQRQKKKEKKRQHHTLMTSTPNSTTALPKIMLQQPNLVQRERETCGR